MSDISPLTEVTNLGLVIEWMQEVIKAYESKFVTKKITSGLAKKTLKKVNEYSAKPDEIEDYAKVVDLCTSLSTIDRAEGSFEKFYLDSLKEELDSLLKALLGE